MSNKEHIERLEALRQFTMGFDDSIDFAISAIKGTESKTEWISITERWPDKTGSYLIYTPENGVGEASYVLGKLSWLHYRYIDNNANPTHWRPLPEPPKA